METLMKLNRRLEKVMPLLTPLSLAIGVLFADQLSGLLPVVPVVFAFITFSGSLNSNFRDVSRIFMHPLPLVVMLLSLHVLVPGIASLVGRLLFPQDPYIVAGMVLQLVIPSAIVSMMWVTIYRGNFPMSLALVLVDTIAAPVVIPLSLRLFLGSVVELDPTEMMIDLAFMVALPALAALTINQLTRGRVKTSVSPALAPFSKFALMFVVAVNSTKVAPFLRNLSWKMVAVTVVMFLLAASAYSIGWLLATLLRQKRDVVISMTFNIGMRNISTGAVVAGAYFPPETMFPVMITTLFQQILAALFGYLISRRYPNPEEAAPAANPRPEKSPG